MSNTSQMAPITEDDIANYLANTPDFFERHAELLAAVQLTHPHSQRAVSLQERQALMLREKIKSLEHRIMDMIRHGHENMVLTDKLHRWACDMLAAPAAELPVLAVENIRELFQVPQVALRLWDVADSSAAYAQGVSESVRTHAATLETPYVGPSQEVEAVQWLEAPAQAASVALMALRHLSYYLDETPACAAAPFRSRRARRARNRDGPPLPAQRPGLATARQSAACLRPRELKADR